MSTGTNKERLTQNNNKIDGITTIANTLPTITTQEKTVTPTTNEQIITPDSGYTGLSQVTVKPSLIGISNPITSPRITANITSISADIDFSSMTDMSYMFYYCSSLTTIPLINTSSVTNMSYMFYSCSSLTTIPLIDTSSVTNMSFMFQSCSSLTTIPLIDTSSVTNMQSMFQSCSSLTTIPLIDTSSVTNMQYMFYSCSSLTTIPLIDTSSVTNMLGMFSSCTSLTDDSLNNILKMCINAVSYTRTKTLASLGFTSKNYPASRIQALSNYQDFINAGWTIGY